MGMYSVLVFLGCSCSWLLLLVCCPLMVFVIAFGVLLRLLRVILLYALPACIGLLKVIVIIWFTGMFVALFVGFISVMVGACAVVNVLVYAVVSPLPFRSVIAFMGMYSVLVSPWM